MGHVCVLVHAGALFTSARGQVDACDIEDAINGILSDIASAEGLVVIDGMLSDAIPRVMNAAIEEKLMEAAAAGKPAYRLWGCDAGEHPFPGWESFGDLPSPVGDGQEEMAERVAPHLKGCNDILVTGAWATSDGSSGCVCSVVDALRLSGLTGVRLSDSALLEPDWDDPEP
ncbi:MAG: hypothetical protein ABJN42_03705 [Roseibium sp.]|uniref:hypothetical protein n=1 Tax=Roseibium sp. TaxID=1936156 RepID=UPI003296C7D7